MMARGVRGRERPSASRGGDGFVEGKSGLQLFLELGVVEDVIPPKGLLHHQQLNSSKPLQVLDIGQRCKPSLHHGQENIGVRVADDAHEIEILAGLDLQFDALVAGAKFGGTFSRRFQERLQSQETRRT